MGINRRKSFVSFLAFILCSSSLVSCSLFNRNSNPDAKKIEDPTFTINEDGTKSWVDHVDNTKMLSYQGIKALESTGDQKILVVPVSFVTDEYNEFNNVPTCKDKTYKETLYTSFFGESEETGWESIKSYYYKSSYGKLNITGDVLDEITMNHNLDYYNSLVSAGRSVSSVISDLTEDIFSIALDKNPNFDFDSFDKDKDGVIDAMWFVYNAKYERNRDLSWAFTTTNPDSQRNLKYKVGTFSWASYWFLEEGKENGTYYDDDNNLLPDCHTFIHETGHILGLDDYYSYDSTEAPTGGLDMMDFNIGDHMAFSKFLLDWVDPKEIITTGTYTLRDFAKYGDCYIIGNNYNGTAFDEYLILEYYTPTNLNVLDSTVGYSMGSKMFSKSGLRIYHVDSRLGYVNNNLEWNKSYIEKVDHYINGNTFAYIINNNTPSYCLGNQTDALVELVSERTQGDLVSLNPYARPVANNTDLFCTNEKLSSYAFNDGSSLAYSITVTSITEENLTITISQ